MADMISGNIKAKIKSYQYNIEKELRKVGDKKNIKSNVRIISATDKNLYEMVQKKMFRGDLYYRLNVIPLKLPSLKDRSEEIPLLVEHMANVYSDKLKKCKRGIKTNNGCF